MVSFMEFGSALDLLNIAPACEDPINLLLIIQLHFTMPGLDRLVRDALTDEVSSPGAFLLILIGRHGVSLRVHPVILDRLFFLNTR